MGIKDLERKIELLEAKILVLEAKVIMLENRTLPLQPIYYPYTPPWKNPFWTDIRGNSTYLDCSNLSKTPTYEELFPIRAED